MNNEPVAWINVEERRLEWDKPTLWETPTVVKLDRIPLYTHPANPYQSITDTKIEPTVVSYTHPVKELTDEEINQIWLEFDARDTHDWFIAIARAILRKAQEQ